mmetsp:Transcript_26375/g.29605  ORF Transcript_26375/g.29605 Transcript_26375/m.29605 type:complete len:329 (+) Transcript_26375:168-1154(+)
MNRRRRPPPPRQLRTNKNNVPHRNFLLRTGSIIMIAISCSVICSAFNTPNMYLKPLLHQHASEVAIGGGGGGGGGRRIKKTKILTTRTTSTTTSITPTTSALQAGRKRSPPQPTAADFEYQELQIQLNAMREQNIKPSQLDPVKINELKRYVENILASRQQLSKAVDSSVPLHLKLRAGLPGTKWRMAFTTQKIMAETLPKDATIVLTFASSSTIGCSNKVDYGLDFFKTLALKRLVAKSTYTVMDPMPNNPTAAIVEIVYDNISTDVFGFSNVGIGTFGMLKGRSTYIQTVYFDDKLWIESSVEGEGNDSQICYNVYTRDYDDDDDE